MDPVTASYVLGVALLLMGALLALLMPDVGVLFMVMGMSVLVLAATGHTVQPFVVHAQEVVCQ